MSLERCHMCGTFVDTDYSTEFYNDHMFTCGGESCLSEIYLMYIDLHNYYYINDFEYSDRHYKKIFLYEKLNIVTKNILDEKYPNFLVLADFDSISKSFYDYLLSTYVEHHQTFMLPVKNPVNTYVEYYNDYIIKNVVDCILRSTVDVYLPLKGLHLEYKKEINDALEEASRRNYKIVKL